MLTDIAFISILLVVAQILRDRVPWLRLALVPTSMVAGIIGLVLGPHALGLIPFTIIADSTNSQFAISQYPGILIVVVFATLLMGREPSQVHQGDAWRRLSGVRDMLFYSLATEIGQYGLAILFGLTVLSAFYPGLPDAFGVMLASGFAGGHGTATIFGQGFKAHGWDDAMAVGFVFATVGMAAAIVGGIILINVAVRRRWTGAETWNLDTPATTTPPFAGKEHRSNSATIDSLTWHLALVGAVLGITYGLNALVQLLLPGSSWIPLFAVSMLVGAVLQRALDVVGIGTSVDRPTMRRIGSTAADFLVASGIASVSVDVLWQYAGPILLMSLFGVLYALAVFAIAPWCFRGFWFERALFTYAWNTGVVGYGVALLRVVDPQYRSRTLEDYGTACLVISPVELLLYPAIVWACASGHFLAAGISLTIISAMLFLAAFRIACECSPSLPVVAVDSIKGQTI